MEAEGSKQRVVLITGAAQGIGRAAAEAFLEKFGDIVALTDRNEPGVCDDRLRARPVRGTRAGGRPRAVR